MTQAFIVSPIDAKLLSLAEWKALVEQNADLKITDAEYVCIVPDDGRPFMFPKKSLGDMPWGDADAAAKAYRFQIPGYEGKVPSLPSRVQGTHIGDANYALYESLEVRLDDLLDKIGGERFSGANAWSASRNNAVYFWIFNGYRGFANGSYLYSSYRALPVLLYDANVSEL